MIRRSLRGFLRHHGGALAPIAALSTLALVLAAGSAVDIGRAARLRSLLQDVADSAALAGASQPDPTSATNSATAYVQASLAALSDKPAVTATYTPSAAGAYSNPSGGGLAFSVQLSTKMPTMLASLVVPTVPIDVSATASSNFVKKVGISLNNFNSSAVDTDTIYAYGYNPSSYASTLSLYKYAPGVSNSDKWTCVFSNKTVAGCPSAGSATSVIVTIPIADNVAFALSNTTGTPSNCYGLSTGATSMYYSTRLDSSGQYHDYPTSTVNYCGWATSVIASDKTKAVDNYQPVVVGSNYANQCQGCEYQTYYYNCGAGKASPMQCKGTQPPSGATWNLSLPGDASQDYGYVYPSTSSRNPLWLSTASLDCTSGKPTTYSWDDNGGGSDAYINNTTTPADDDDHNDIVFTVTCTTAVSQSGAKLTK